MCRFDRAISEMFFDPEQIDPAFGNREPNHDVLTRDLAQLSTDEPGNQNVRSEFDLKETRMF